MNRIAVSVVISGFCATWGSIAVADSTKVRYEFWPEIQLHWRLDSQTRIIALGNASSVGEVGQRTEGQLGIALDYRFTNQFSVRGGYRYVTSLVKSDPSTEHRALFEQTFWFRLPFDVLLSLRTREDLRSVNGKFSARVRERALFERDVKISDYTFTPYASAEFYYDTRYGQFSRNRFNVGSVFPIAKSVSVDISLNRQNDSRSQPKHINALGLTFIVSF